MAIEQDHAVPGTLGHETTDRSRRTFLREASLGLAASAGGALLLRADALPTRATAEEVALPPGVSPDALEFRAPSGTWKKTANGQAYETAVFDVVLERA